MENLNYKLELLKKKETGYWAERILSQLGFALKLPEYIKIENKKALADAFIILDQSIQQYEVITKEIAIKAEGIISGLSEAAKKIKIICASHAHIDMNWMWGYAETVAITLDTFRTMLDMMKEYPDFTFSQSQASVYKIVEEHDPVMLDEIRQRIREGRWEVTASTWVETDKNMPTGESLARHILYTKKYLSDLLGLDPDSLNLDFEPDTFGHSKNIPEILCNGGVKYYYHCRGAEVPDIYIWKAPSGNSVITYREPDWYNSRIDPVMVDKVPAFCGLNGIDTSLKVYGVGNHGGGPTRKDIERIIDMGKWPVFPDIHFGTFREFFGVLDKNKDKFKEISGELNFIFTGCYTTQTRIKLANRIAESRLAEAEAFGALYSPYSGRKFRTDVLRKAWEKTMFNHFHDILPGSGVIDTREYSMGLFQQVLAVANTEASKAMKLIASDINTQSLDDFTDNDIIQSDSEGAGVGYGIKDFYTPQSERGCGKKRVLHFFNPTPIRRKEAVQVTVWDWPGDMLRLRIKNEDGIAVDFQVLEDSNRPSANPAFWGHTYFRVLVSAEVSAYGYSTYLLYENDDIIFADHPMPGPRQEILTSYILENDMVRVEFDSQNASIKSFRDNKTGREMLDTGTPSGIFRLIEEDDSKGMTSWVVGRYMNISLLNKNVKIKQLITGTNKLRQWIKYELGFGKSILSVTASLDSGSPMLRFDVRCDWLETAVKGQFVPQLNFHIPLAYECKGYRYDVPFGTVDRVDMDMDVPANSWVLGIPENDDQEALMLISGSKYGFRGTANTISHTLIRSSYQPDPYPELGVHEFWFAFGPVEATSDRKQIEMAQLMNNPVKYMSGTAHNGVLPLKQEFLNINEGTIAISSVKCLEDDKSEKGIVLRIYETDGKDTTCELEFSAVVENAYFVDINERPVKNTDKIDFSRKIIRFKTAANCIKSIAIILRN